MGLEDLTVRETHVLQQLRQGMNNPEIARALHISVDTVKEHLQNLMKKLQVKNRTQAALVAEREACARTAEIYSSEAAAAIRNQEPSAVASSESQIA